MEVVLATDSDNNILNAPSEAPEGKVLINLHETCNEKHKNEADNGGILSSNGDEGNKSEPNTSNPSGTAKTDDNKKTPAASSDNTTTPTEPGSTEKPDTGTIFGQ